MDLWDLTKLLVRRWVIALPMLLVAVLSSLWVWASVEPDYVSTSYVSLVAPNPADPSHRIRNPWLDTGLSEFGQAVIVTVQDKSVIQAMDAAGLSSDFTLTIENNQSLVTIEVVGQTSEQAAATTREINRLLDANVVSLQNASGVSGQDLITTRRLDLSGNVEERNARVVRAVVAVAVVGVLLAVAVTVGVDAMMRRRSGPDAGEHYPGSGRRYPAQPYPSDSGSRRLALPGGGRRPPAPPVQPALSSGTGEWHQAPPYGAGGSSGGPGPGAPGGSAAGSPGSPPYPADSTIVLPLSMRPRDKKGRS